MVAGHSLAARHRSVRTCDSPWLSRLQTRSPPGSLMGLPMWRREASRQGRSPRGACHLLASERAAQVQEIGGTGACRGATPAQPCLSHPAGDLRSSWVAAAKASSLQGPCSLLEDEPPFASEAASPKLALAGVTLARWCLGHPGAILACILGATLLL